MSALCWTVDRYKLLATLVRRHAFDFDAASQAFRGHLEGEDADFINEDVSPGSLRKAFADQDRRRTTSKGPPARIIPATEDAVVPPRLPPKIRGGTNETREPLAGEIKRTLQDSSETFGNDTPTTTIAHGSSDVGTHLLRDPSREKTDDGAAIVLAGSPTSSSAVVAVAQAMSDSNRTFDSILEEQRSKEKQLDARKESTFRRVLSALGGPAMDHAALPADVLLAWETRNEKLTIAEEKAKETQQKLKEARDLALQREVLKKRHLPGGEDSIGDDPLVALSEDLTSCSSPYCDPLSSAGAVQLELGMDAKELDNLLTEIEESPVADRHGRADSELSGVLDILDKAAGSASGATYGPRHSEVAID